MITLVYSYYNSGSMLERHMTEWRQYNRKDAYNAIIVDDASPLEPAKDHIENVGFEVKVYRIQQNIPWNIPGARNLGMDRARDGWCLLTDIDHLLSAHDADNLARFEQHLRVGRFYLLSRKWADGRPLHNHANSYVIRREDYWKVGGTDEDFSGFWGAGERTFRSNLRTIAQQVNLSAVFLTHFGRHDIADASTTDWGRRDSAYDWKKNPLLVAKMEQMPYRPIDPFRFNWERVA